VDAESLRRGAGGGLLFAPVFTVGGAFTGRTPSTTTVVTSSQSIPCYPTSFTHPVTGRKLRRARRRRERCGNRRRGRWWSLRRLWAVWASSKEVPRGQTLVVLYIYANPTMMDATLNHPWSLVTLVAVVDCPLSVVGALLVILVGVIHAFAADAEVHVLRAPPQTGSVVTLV
jgi:hypothetical protein